MPEPTRRVALGARARRWARRAADAARARTLGPGPQPDVTVVVVVRGAAGHLDDCLASLTAAGTPSSHRTGLLLACAEDDVRAREAVRQAVASRDTGGPLGLRAAPPVPADRLLGAALSLVETARVAFVSTDDLLPPGALARLCEVLAESGSEVALGVHVDVRGAARRRVTWAPALRDVRRTTLAASPELVVDLAPTGKVFRTAALRALADRGTGLGGWRDAPLTVARVLAEADGIDTVGEVVYERVDRGCDRPVGEQDRFRPDALAQRLAVLAALDDWAGTQPRPVASAWRGAVLTHLLPPEYPDAVAGGEANLERLGAAVRAVAAHTDTAALAAVPLPHRLSAWAAAWGGPGDPARVADHLADHPDGLPLEPGDERLAQLPAELVADPPPPWRRVEPVDERLHSRVAARLVVGDGEQAEQAGHAGHAGALVELTGAAFCDYVADGRPVEVAVGGEDEPVLVTVRPRPDPGLEAWAARAHESHAGCGFTGSVALSDLAGGGRRPLVVRVALGGQAHEHRLPPVLPAPPEPDLALTPLGVADEATPRLSVEVAGRREWRVRLVGGRGVTEVVAGDTGSTLAELPLSTDLFGEPAPLPAGRYAVEALTGSGDRLTTGLVGGPGAIDLVGPTLGVTPVATPTGVRVDVGLPLLAEERSRRGQQRLREAAAPRRVRLPRTVLVETFRGRSAGDGPGAVARALLAADPTDVGDPAGLDVAVVVDDPSVVVPAGARAVVRRSRAWHEAMGGAAAYVSNAGAPYWWTKPAGGTHVQTWHGTPLKRIGEDRGPGDFATWRHRRRIADQAAGWDAMVSPSPYCSEIFRRAFGYRGPMLEVGYPRNDVLVSPEAPGLREAVRRRLGLVPDDRVLLYAPTWREYVGVRDAKPLYLDAQRVVDAAPGTVVLLRGHYNSTGQDDVFAGHPRIRDVTRFPDIAELFLAADALVSDYSSVIFDFALTDRPMVLLVPDLEQYRDVERGFYLDLEEVAPGPLVRHTDDVLAALDALDAHAPARAAFRERFCPWDDGHASERVARFLLDRLPPR